MKTNRKKILFEKQDGKCIYCNQKFPEEKLLIEHLFPRDKFDDAENILVLSCYNCNAIKANKIPFNELEFNLFIKDILEHNPNFRQVEPEYNILNKNKYRYRFDFIAERKIKNSWKKILIEIKSFPTFTNPKLEEIINQLQKYTSLFTEEIQPILVFPGKLSESAYQLLKENNIEVWDLDYISKNFSKEIEKSNFTLLQNIFLFREEEKKGIDHQLIDELKVIAKGKEAWSRYQKHIGKILSFLFSDSLSDPISELPDKIGINRRDFILRNYEENGFWKYIREKYQADFIVIDAKNYSKRIEKNQILQISNYLKAHGTGLFAMIISRSGLENQGSYYTRREIWITERKMIVILSDQDIESMVIAKANSNKPEEIIKQKIEQFRLEM